MKESLIEENGLMQRQPIPFYSQAVFLMLDNL